MRPDLEMMLTGKTRRWLARGKSLQMGLAAQTKRELLREVMERSMASLPNLQGYP